MNDIILIILVLHFVDIKLLYFKDIQRILILWLNTSACKFFKNRLILQRKKKELEKKTKYCNSHKIELIGENL